MSLSFSQPEEAKLDCVWLEVQPNFAITDFHCDTVKMRHACLHCLSLSASVCVHGATADLHSLLHPSGLELHHYQELKRLKPKIKQRKAAQVKLQHVACDALRPPTIYSVIQTVSWWRSLSAQRLHHQILSPAAAAQSFRPGCCWTRD